MRPVLTDEKDHNSEPKGASHPDSQMVLNGTFSIEAAAKFSGFLYSIGNRIGRMSSLGDNI
jgi:hypothetical protein